MSTLGKVLVVLVLLPMLGWLYLASGLAELHRNYGRRVVERRDNLAQLQDEIPKTRGEIFASKAQIDQVQRERDSRLTALRGVISLLYKQDSVTRESLERYQLQAAAATEAQADAEARQKTSETTLALLTQQRDDTFARIEELRQADAQARQELAQLRQKLDETLQQSRRLVAQRLGQADSARAADGARAAARPALEPPAR